MIFLVSFICALIAVWGFFNKDRYFFNPVTTMFAIWAIILPFSALNLYKVPPISDKALYIITIGLLGYLLGILLSERTYKVTFFDKVIHDPCTKFTFNYKLLYFLYTIALIYLLFSAAVALRLLAQGYNLAYIRSLATAEDTNALRSSIITITIKNFLATPVVYLAIAIMPIELLMGNKNKIIVITTLLMIFCWVISVGGRSIILWTILYFIAVFLFAKGKSFSIYISKRVKRLIVFSIILLFGFLLWSTLSRKGAGTDLWRQIFIYYIAPLKHFDKYVEKIDTQYSNFYGHGAASFYGFAYPFLFLYRLLFGHGKYPAFWTLVRDLSFSQLEHTTWLGGDIQMNAFVTIFYQPYIDGRFVGVFVICFLFGIACGYTYKLAYRFKNIKYVLIYLLFLQKIFDSMVRFYFTQTSQVMCLIYALFVCIPILQEEKE